MGLGVKVLVRHPEGEPDLLCPTAWCDVCGKELTGESQDGCSDVYAYVSPNPDEDGADDFYEGRTHVPLYLAHGGRCYESMRGKDGFTLSHMPTDWLIVHLAQNMGKGMTAQEWSKLYRWVMDRPV